jgi:hypothetical protein
VLVRGKGNLANGVPTLEFAIRSRIFNLNGHTFNQPHAVEWEPSKLKISDVLPGTGNRTGQRDPENVDAVEAR